MSRRIIIATIIFFLFVIFFEILYIFVLSKNVQTSTSQPNNNTESIQNITNISPSLVPINFQPAINQEILDFFKMTRSTAHVSSKISQQYKGTIYEITSQRYRNDSGDIYTVYELYLTDGDTTDKSLMNSFIITDQVLSIAKFIDQDTNNSFQITDLKNGDNITINHTIDLTKPSGTGVGYEKFEIIRSI
ncbi:MAG TPA: hypothetical protein PLS49_04970 [Candidatus Woesebacteria bacterium]|nr:hypothetical protein [Candidatus Woesebacteria bacterium]